MQTGSFFLFLNKKNKIIKNKQKTTQSHTSLMPATVSILSIIVGQLRTDLASKE